VIEKAFELAGPQYRARHVELEWIEGVTSTHLLMDATLLLRLTMNLLSNALHASIAGTRVEVQLQRVHRSTAPGRWLRLRVADQGRGFSAPRLAQLLSTPFGLRERRGDEGGFGIGLSICRRIVRMHQGHMAISSVEGSGTVINVDFPQKDNL
jgi:signal transduction histidine kinase